MSKVILLTPYLTDRDAIGNDILETRRLLRAHGLLVEICAELVDLKGDQILSIDKGRKLLAQPDNVLIYHHSVGWERGLNIVLAAQCRRVVRYHNITPPAFFSCYNPNLAAACRTGRDHLARLAASDIDLFVSDSEFNQEELLALGVDAKRSRVVPPFHVIHRLKDAPADGPVARRCGERQVNLINVGRIVPNKGHSHLLKAFAAYHHLYNRDSRLWIIGKEEPDQQDYGRAIRRIATTLQLADSVVFTGGVSEAELKTFYQSADAFIITSEHEGFCVPVVEAMAFETPVIAYGATALPGTIQHAGIVWDRCDPVLFAATIHALMKNSMAADALRRRGRARFDRQFSIDQIAKQFFASLQSVIPGLANEDSTQTLSHLASDAFDIDDFKQGVEFDAARMKARFLAEDLAPSSSVPRVAEETLRSRMGKLFELVCDCDSLYAEQALEQIEQNLYTASENSQLLREIPAFRRRSWPLQWALQFLMPIIVKFGRFLGRSQTIYNNNTNQALHHLMALHRHTLAQLKEQERRLTKLEAAASLRQRRVAA